jgi:hypothetical protein
MDEALKIFEERLGGGYVRLTFGDSTPWAMAYIARCDCCDEGDNNSGFWFGQTPIDETEDPAEALLLAIEDALKRYPDYPWPKKVA